MFRIAIALMIVSCLSMLPAMAQRSSSAENDSKSERPLSQIDKVGLNPQPEIPVKKANRVGRNPQPEPPGQQSGKVQLNPQSIPQLSHKPPPPVVSILRIPLAGPAMPSKLSSMQGWLTLEGSGVINSAPAVMTLSGIDRYMQVFAAGTDGAIWSRTQIGANLWTLWSSLGGQASSEPAVSTWDGQNAVLVVKTSNGSYAFMRLSGSTWSDWQSLGGQFLSAPSVAAKGSGHYEVFGIGMDGAIWQSSFDGVTPGAWKSLGLPASGKKFVYPPAVVAQSATMMEMIAITEDDQMYRKTWHDSWANWTVWDPVELDPDPAFSSGPAIAFSASNTMLILARAGRAWNLYGSRLYNNTNVFTAWKNWGGFLLTRPAAVARSTHQIEVFTIGADSSLCWKTFTD